MPALDKICEMHIIMSMDDARGVLIQTGIALSGGYRLWAVSTNALVKFFWTLGKRLPPKLPAGGIFDPWSFTRGFAIGLHPLAKKISLECSFSAKDWMMPNDIDGHWPTEGLPAGHRNRPN
jgi:hypothetical protein